MHTKRPPNGHFDSGQEQHQWSISLNKRYSNINKEIYQYVHWLKISHFSQLTQYILFVF